MCNILHMKKQDKWLTIKIPRNLKKEFENIENDYPNFAQFAQFSLRKELAQLLETSKK